LRALFAARGIFGAFAGPWSAGTSAALLWQAAIDGQPSIPAAFIKGGLGTLSESLAKAALAMGAGIRTSAEAVKIQVSEEKATKVLLQDGEEIASGTVISSLDPRSTFLRLVDPIDLDPDFLSKIRNYRAVGTVAKVNLALSALPSFPAVNGTASEKLTGRIHVGPEIDYLERAFDAAKYGTYSPAPYLDITIPSLTDPSLAPSGAHVMSIHVQFAPYKLKGRDWGSAAQPLGDTVVNTLSTYAPKLKELILARQVITPLDLETTYGLSGGHIFHGEQSLDQFFVFRPLLGWSQYRTPIKGLYLCGSGTHPGGGLTGGPGANAAREIVKDLKRSK
jgi:phytoene dehydrogenase-like protein